MKDLEELIKNVKHYQDAVIQKRFISKKNTVAYVIINGKPRVLKWYPPAFSKQMTTEYTVLKNGSSKLNIPVPTDIDSDNNVLMMNYISGKNLCDVINDTSVNFQKKTGIIMRLAEWFANFHLHFKRRNQFFIRGDSTLRNFIVDNRLWGVDFEEFREGKPVEDIAGVCSSILSTDPMFTNEKFKLCKTFIKSYSDSLNWKLDNLNEETAYALLMKIQWRPEDEETLRKYAKRIKKYGIL